MRILLARHGETPWNAEGRYQGQEDIPLSEVGIAQATALGERLRDVRIDRAILGGDVEVPTLQGSERVAGPHSG